MTLPSQLQKNAPLLWLIPILLLLTLSFYDFYQMRMLLESLSGNKLQTDPVVYNLYLTSTLFLFYTIILTTAAVILVIKNRALSLKKSQLTEEVESSQRVLSVTSHELYSPLSNIKSSLYVLIPELPEEYRKFAQRAIESSEQLISLLDSLLTAAHFEQGSVKLNRQPASLEKICADIVDQYREPARKKNATLTLEKPSEPLPLISIDEEKIRETVINLLSNAIKYSPGGEIKIKVTKKNGDLLVAVSDEGPGIGPEDIKRLFNRFVRIKATAQNQKGTGLGLYISRLIVEAHKGKIWAESPSSEGGKGSTFYFSLPLSASL